MSLSYWVPLKTSLGFRVLLRMSRCLSVHLRTSIWFMVLLRSLPPCSSQLAYLPSHPPLSIAQRCSLVQLGNSLLSLVWLWMSCRLLVLLSSLPSLASVWSSLPIRPCYHCCSPSGLTAVWWLVRSGLVAFQEPCLKRGGGFCCGTKDNSIRAPSLPLQNNFCCLPPFSV